MSEPTTPGTVGRQIAALRAEVAALENLVQAIAGSVVTERNATSQAITRLEKAVGALLPDQEEDTEDEPAAWVDYADADDWSELADWVDWLVRTYDLSDRVRVRPCWPAHPGVAEELAALRSAWREAARRARGKDNDALAFWHDRYLAPFVTRMNTMYTTVGCQSTKHEPQQLGRLTDRDLITVRSAAGDRQGQGSAAGQEAEAARWRPD